MLTLRPLSLAELAVLRETEMTEAFPPAELKPFAAMKALYDSGLYHPMGAYEGETLVGYAILWESPGTRYLLLDYLGVLAERRNQGLGGQILQCLKTAFSHWDGILAESEAPDGGPNDALRRRRMGFYTRNGFAFLDYACLLFGTAYAVCLCSPNGTGTPAQAQAAHRAVYRAQFSEQTFTTSIHIPWDTTQPIPPGPSWVEMQGIESLP